MKHCFFPQFLANDPPQSHKGQVTSRMTYSLPSRTRSLGLLFYLVPVTISSPFSSEVLQTEGRNLSPEKDGWPQSKIHLVANCLAKRNILGGNGVHIFVPVLFCWFSSPTLNMLCRSKSWGHWDHHWCLRQLVIYTKTASGLYVCHDCVGCLEPSKDSECENLNNWHKLKEVCFTVRFNYEWILSPFYAKFKFLF